ncbi:MAG: hypothetical protein AAF849_21470 [Bacteroidota bacterium]
MKTSFFIQLLIAFFVLTACSKETLVTPDSLEQNSTQQHLHTMPNSDKHQHLSVPATSQSSQAFTVAVDVDLPTVNVTATELIAELTANYDFSTIIPATTQAIKLVDAQGNVSTFSFDLNTYTGEDGRFSVQFDLGGQSLSGLTILPTQVIGVEDVLMF